LERGLDGTLAEIAAAKTGLEKFIVAPPRADPEPEVVEPDEAAAAGLNVARASHRPAAEDSLNAWPDDAAESSFLSEAKARGEPVVASAAGREAAEEAEPKGALPPLGELVSRIPTEVREVLDELFRVKFVTVKRIPKKALKA